MTKEQIDILLRDGDIISSAWVMSKNHQNNPEVEMLMFGSCPNFYSNGKLYDLNDNLIESLNQIFELHSSFESLRITTYWWQKIDLLMQKTLKEQKAILLKNNVQKELEKKQYFQENMPEWVVHSIKPGWMYLHRNNLETIIETLKFKIFEGKAIKNFNTRNPAFNYMDEFFGKQSELNPIYELIAANKKLEYLQAKINEIESRDKKLLQSSTGDEIFKNAKSSQIKPQKNRALKPPQIALIHIYERSQITEENSRLIAAEYGYTSKTSGIQLLRRYCKFAETSNRTGKPTPCTKVKLGNKIKLFKSIIEYLSLSAKKRAKDEIKILDLLYEQEYE